MILKGKQIRGTINLKIGFIKTYNIVFKVFVFRIENVLEGFFDYSS